MTQMTWHETIEYIQSTPSYAALVHDTYITTDLAANVERFRQSAEFEETLQLLPAPTPAPKLLDLGAGNGIASIAFALSGFEVTALEPDPSPTVGSGAIKALAQLYQLSNLRVVEAFGESLPFENGAFDIVYGRQVMHHAHHLETFVTEAARVLKSGGILMTVRDHVVADEKDKQKFLARHPLHGFYGGENAFTLEAYREAFKKARLMPLHVFSPSASSLNYDPWTKAYLKKFLSAKAGHRISFASWLVNIVWKLIMFRKERIPGKLYSFIFRKP